MEFNILKAIETSLGINRQATKIAIGGFVVMALAIGLVQLADDDKLTFWRLLAAQVGLMIFMLVITQLPLLARRLLAWVMAMCFSFMMVTATVQSVTENYFRPPLALASCIISFYFADSCSSSTAVTDNQAFALVGAAFAQDGSDVTAVPALTGPELAAAQAKSVLFIQFAQYPRSKVIDLAASLVRGGWNVEGADRGGERIVSATGLNEVRYFNPDDAALAVALRDAIKAASPDKDVTVQDLSASKYGKGAPGHLEIWVSE